MNNELQRAFVAGLAPLDLLANTIKKGFRTEVDVRGSGGRRKWFRRPVSIRILNRE